MHTLEVCRSFHKDVHARAPQDGSPQNMGNHGELWGTMGNYGGNMGMYGGMIHYQWVAVCIVASVREECGDGNLMCLQKQKATTQGQTPIIPHNKGGIWEWGSRKCGIKVFFVVCFLFTTAKISSHTDFLKGASVL